MIEVDAEILRGSCTPVFFVGETLECEICFRCVSAKETIFGKKKRQDLEIQQNEIKEKDRFLLENEIDDSKVEEITESMFSILSTIPSTPSVSTNLSLPTTPSSSSSKSNFKSSQSYYSDLASQQTTPTGDEQIIAWACAQIDCHCYIDESKVILPKDPLRYNLNHENKVNEASNTSFQPNKDRVGISVYSSKPKILFCNLALRPNESKSFRFRETLPYDLAPTFRGQFAKYSYKLTIGVQKLNRSTQLLRLPFRVYSLLDFEKYIPKPDLVNVVEEETYFETRKDSLLSLNQSDTVNDTSDSFDSLKEQPNPFLVVEKSEYENLEYALQVLEDVCARMSTNTYNVTVPDGKIVKITINKTNYKIGDKLIVFLDFSEAQIPCVEFKVTLQSEEIIAEECRKNAKQIQPGLHSHAELKEYSLFLKKTDLTMQIPVHITPTFVSDIISLRWRLHFDFALSRTPLSKIQKSNDPAMSVTWRPPNSLTVEVISWDLPIQIHPFDPFIASDLIYSTSNQSSDNSHLELK